MIEVKVKAGGLYWDVSSAVRPSLSNGGGEGWLGDWVLAGKFWGKEKPRRT